MDSNLEIIPYGALMKESK